MSSTLQFPVAQTLLKQAFLGAFQRLAMCIALFALKAVDLYVKHSAFRVFLGRKPVAESSVPDFGLLMRQAVYRAQRLVHQSAVFFLANIFAFEAFSAQRVNALCRGYINSLRAKAWRVGVVCSAFDRAFVNLRPCGRYAGNACQKDCGFHFWAISSDSKSKPLCLSSRFRPSLPVNAAGVRDGSPVAGARTDTKFKRQLRPWDIQIRLPDWPDYRYQQTIFAVSERAAIYQWKKGNALPLGGRVRAVPEPDLFYPSLF